MELIAEAGCWQRVIAELERVQPAEGLAVPLLGLERDPRAAPWVPLELDSLRCIALVRAVLLPPGRQTNRPFGVWALGGAERAVQHEIDYLLARHPRLRPCAFLHSHPFAVGSTRPSGVDVHGHMEPLLESNRSSALEAAFSLIACRAGPGGGWRLQAFALDGGGRLHELGFFRPVPAGHPAVRAALQPALSRRPPWRRRLRRWRRALAHRGLRVRAERLFDGWLREVIPLAPAAEPGRLVVLLPDDWPRREARFLAVPAAGGRAVALAAERDWQETDDAWARLVERAQEVLENAR